MLVSFVSSLIVAILLLYDPQPVRCELITVFKKGEAGYYCHKIPYLFVTVKNTLLALAEARGKGQSSCNDFTGTDLVIKRSYDLGKTWSELQVLISNSSTTEQNVVGNAAPVQDNAGRIWMPFCRNNEEIFIIYSDDDGMLWSKPLALPHLVLDGWKWVGLGPPSGLKLSTGRLLIPGYHTSLWKGDGCVSKAHTMYSDDNGQSWALGSEDFGDPYFPNEAQAVELKNGSILINARTISTHRLQMRSDDGGITFSPPWIVADLIEPIEGCEGSFIRDAETDILYYSGSYTNGVIRKNMTILTSKDEGMSWTALVVVDKGATSYSALAILDCSLEVFTPSNHVSTIVGAVASKTGTTMISRDNRGGKILALLYERSTSMNIIFEPDEIVLYRFAL